MVDLATPENIKEQLHLSLKPLEKLSLTPGVALLNYPNYRKNIGDHFIGLGTVLYLLEVLKAKNIYIANLKYFSAAVMQQQINSGPIFLQGGGNLGDIWQGELEDNHQLFREKIICDYPDRPIVIFPQSIHFQNPDNLKKAAQIFNSHPDLTLFVRDDYSYNLAMKHFFNCKTYKSPDMAFHSVNLAHLPLTVKPKQSLLYLCREDQEQNSDFTPQNLGIKPQQCQEWVAMSWKYREDIQVSDPFHWLWQQKGTVRFYREFIQRGVLQPREWWSRRQWENNHPIAPQLKALGNADVLDSWNYLHSACYQLKHTRILITNRLHGHILAILLGIPHVFLPNSYHKNEQFYQTWTHQIPFARFVKDPAQVKSIADELLAQYYP